MTRSHGYSLGLTVAALALFATPVLAQTTPVPNPDPAAKEAPVDRGYDKDTPKHEAVDAQEQPTTQTLNNAVAAVNNDAAQINADNQAQNVDAQAQYEADRAAYRAAVEAHNRATMGDAVRYERQQRAYADAYAAWRVQAEACKRGKHKACKAPTPNPADFY